MKSRFKVGDRVVTVLLMPALARIVGAAVLTVLIIGLTVAFADGGRPPPVPQLSTGCPPGYSGSRTSGTCVPSGNTRCRAFPAPTGSCPVGWSYSPTSQMCVETACR
jgi:hypothetical protein